MAEFLFLFKVKLLELDKSGIHVAQYPIVLPPKALLQNKLQEEMNAARQWLQHRSE
jgi:hypothetical protein